VPAVAKDNLGRMLLLLLLLLLHGIVVAVRGTAHAAIRIVGTATDIRRKKEFYFKATY
jgi:hypothetical protein